MSETQHKGREEREKGESEEKRGEEEGRAGRERRRACTFLSLDVLLKFVRHLSPPFPSLMIPAEPLWGTASVVRPAFTFPAPGILGYASGDYEAHPSKSSSGSVSLSLSLASSLSSPIGCTPLPFLVVVVLLHTQTFSVSPWCFLFLSSSRPPFFPPYFLIW